MKKNAFLKTTIILMVGTFITRLLGFIIKILYTRIISPVWVAELNIVMPTYSLLVAIATFCMPITLSKLISENKNRSSKYLFNAAIIMLLINTIVMLIMIFSSEFIANNLLHNPFSKYLIISMTFTLPFISLSSIIKGYFFGKQKMLPYAVSNVLEQGLRLLLISIFLPNIFDKSPSYSLIFLLLLSIVSESFSVLIFMFFLPPKINIHKIAFNYDNNVSKNILNIAVPSILGRLFSNINYFFEPIIITSIMTYIGYKSRFIIYEYSLYNAYALTILLMPSFFIQALSNALLPEISRISYDYSKVKNIFYKTLKISLILGLFFTILISIFGKELLNIFFKTSEAYKYLILLAPTFFLYYLEGPLTSVMQALGYVKKNMQISIIGALIKTISLIVLLFTRTGLYPLVISEIIDIVYVVSANYLFLKKVKLSPYA